MAFNVIQAAHHINLRDVGRLNQTGIEYATSTKSVSSNELLNVSTKSPPVGLLFFH